MAPWEAWLLTTARKVGSRVEGLGRAGTRRTMSVFPDES